MNLVLRFESKSVDYTVYGIIIMVTGGAAHREGPLLLLTLVTYDHQWPSSGGPLVLTEASLL
jgi:hypothetical protein